MTKRSIEEILAAAKKPVRAVQVCLDADLQGEHDELTARLEVLRREPPTARWAAVGGQAGRGSDQQLERGCTRPRSPSSSAG
jgi:hypothetical protein